MKPSETIIYIKYPYCIMKYKLTNNWSQCDFGIYTGEIIQVKREIIIEELNIK